MSLPRLLINLALGLSGRVIAARKDLEKEVKEAGYPTHADDKAYRYTVFRKGTIARIAHVESGRYREVHL